MFRSYLNSKCVSFHVSAGLAVGLDPQGYGNPDFCWLSVHDTLIWSFAGPIFVVVLVSAWLTALCILTERHVSVKRLKVWFQPSLKVNIVIFILAAKASCGRRQKAIEKSGAMWASFHFIKQWSDGTMQRHWSGLSHHLSPALRMAFLLLLLIGATWLLGLMAVNSNVMLFHYLFAVCSCLQVVQRMQKDDLPPAMVTMSEFWEFAFWLHRAFSSSSVTWSSTKMCGRTSRTSLQARKWFQTSPAPQEPLYLQWAHILYFINVTFCLTSLIFMFSLAPHSSSAHPQQQQCLRRWHNIPLWHRRVYRLPGQHAQVSQEPQQLPGLCTQVHQARWLHGCF